MKKLNLAHCVYVCVKETGQDSSIRLYFIILNIEKQAAAPWLHVVHNHLAKWKSQEKENYY